ncbi:MAG: ABC transporter permease [Petrimonas sp.]|nr:ABC transporter permease [Petrimonas sp.]
MLRQYFKQIIQLWKSNPLFSVISVLATAFTIAFVMILCMVYAFRTADTPPEANRSRTLYSDRGYSYLTKDRSNANSGMSKSVANAIFGNLQNAETVSYIQWKGEGMGFVSTAPSNREKKMVSPVDDHFFKIFSYEFLAGQPFTAGQVATESKVAIVTDRIARQYFGSVENAMGKDITVGMSNNCRIVGVVKAVSSLYNKAYSDVWTVADNASLDWGPQYSEGLRGMCGVVLTAKKGSSMKALRKEIDQNIESLNAGKREYTFEQRMLSHAESSFYNKKTTNPIRIFVVLVLILLIVPAINMSGLLSAQMKKRIPEIAIRKAYGASNSEVTSQLLFENLMLTVIGGIVGLLLAVTAVLLFKNILLADLTTVNANASFHLPSELFFDPVIFVLAFLFCFVINLLSAIVPVWSASRTTIMQAIKGE